MWSCKRLCGEVRQGMLGSRPACSWSHSTFWVSGRPVCSSSLPEEMREWAWKAGWQGSMAKGTVVSLCHIRTLSLAENDKNWLRSFSGARATSRCVHLFLTDDYSTGSSCHPCLCWVLARVRPYFLHLALWRGPVCSLHSEFSLWGYWLSMLAQCASPLLSLLSVSLPNHFLCFLISTSLCPLKRTSRSPGICFLCISLLQSLQQACYLLSVEYF